MPAFVKSKKEEELWKKAKGLAEDAGHKEDWPYITSIFKKFNGGKVAMETQGQWTQVQLLACLRALHWHHQTSHWQVSGTDSYEAHLLFERLYTGITGEIDTLAEKIVAELGAATVAPYHSSLRTARFLDVWTKQEPEDLWLRAILAEKTLQSILSACLKAEDVSPGMSNFLEGVYDNHETNLYLLNQRVRPSVVGRVASRYILK